ncbi:hypothetical protein [Paenibacillus uliginis]|uniref:hypothetical protein n=1 Tax=Paenibacillus uliginis TaxID=683737 RepID=UPI001AD7FC80|nr:hypothetical protein [Paenibacillus uliginis]
MSESERIGTVKVYLFQKKSTHTIQKLVSVKVDVSDLYHNQDEQAWRILSDVVK